jgi:hypothetical protein
MTEDIKKKIELEATERFWDFSDTQQERDFIQAAEFGYSLAEQEIERLKILIKKLWNEEHAPNATFTPNDRKEEWQQFKQQNNL